MIDSPGLLVPAWLIPVAGAVLGAILGSFIATVLIRWPRGQSAVGGRSHCDGCDKALGAVELLPILSYLVLRGRCRSCKARIDPHSPAVEVAAALIGLVAALAYPEPHQWPMVLASAGFGWALLTLAALDVEHQWLPDALTLPLIPAGLLVAWLGVGPPLLDRAIGAAAGGLTLWVIGWAYERLRGREGLGGGDPKLLAAIGAWVGWTALPFVLLGAGLIGLLAVLAMRLRGRAVEATTRLPLGALMAVAAWPIWLVGERMLAL